VYLTDGPARRIKAGNHNGILFKHTSEIRRFCFKSELLMLIDSAMRSYGKKNIRPKELEIIKEKLLTYATQKDIESDINLMPVWIRSIVLKLWNS
jgi:hypothetical protein